MKSFRNECCQKQLLRVWQRVSFIIYADAVGMPLDTLLSEIDECIYFNITTLIRGNSSKVLSWGSLL
jgi:hypothetical protein